MMTARTELLAILEGHTAADGTRNQVVAHHKESPECEPDRQLHQQINSSLPLIKSKFPLLATAHTIDRALRLNRQIVIIVIIIIVYEEKVSPLAQVRTAGVVGAASCW